MHIIPSVIVASALIGVVCAATHARVTGEICLNHNRLVHRGLIAYLLAANITEMHNNFRLRIARGEVPLQPRGSNLRRLFYDKALAEKAKEVALRCELNPFNVTDPRWYSVGVNMYLEYSNVHVVTQNWERAITNWFDEYANYFYPLNKKRVYPRATAHYTQLVWAETVNVGCDFLIFKDPHREQTPFGNLYVCIYGPGGNIAGQLPYLVNDTMTECAHLC